MSKGDGFSNVEDRGEIEFNSSVNHEFSEDFQFFSYKFRAGEQALLTLSINESGSWQPF